MNLFVYSIADRLVYLYSVEHTTVYESSFFNLRYICLITWLIIVNGPPREGNNVEIICGKKLLEQWEYARLCNQKCLFDII